MEVHVSETLTPPPLLPPLPPPSTVAGNHEVLQRHAEKTTPPLEEDGAAPPGGAHPDKGTTGFYVGGVDPLFRTHTCPTCGRCFKLRSHLQEHLRLHAPDPRLQCPTCQRHFTSRSKLHVHRLREAGLKVHRCPLCEYSAVERGAIRRHLRGVHEVSGRNYPCPACGQTFGRSQTLKAHMKTHTTPPGHAPTACVQEGCSFQSPLRRKLVRHAAVVHQLTAVACRHHSCHALFSSHAHMERHYQSHVAYHCPHCDFSTANKSTLLRHRRQGHPGVRRLTCDFCTFTTFNPVDFERHLGHLHAREKIHRCPQCTYVTSHKQGLTRHLRRHSGEKPFRCSECEFRCGDQSYLSKHQLIHSEHKDHMCPQCGYRTRWRHYLNIHMRTHTDHYRYHCDKCAYRCHRLDQLKSHQLRHQDKSFMCEICAYACKRKHQLQTHMSTKHSGGGKPAPVYQCKYCAYSSAYRQALQNHENCKHTKLKEFRCALCTYSSFSSISLFVHKRKVHGYKPGDSAWIQKYAAKEEARNTPQTPSTANRQPTKGGENSENRLDSAGLSTDKRATAGLKTVVSKRRVHGYKPGDSTWIHNYTAKKDRNTPQSEFYKTPSTINRQPTEGSLTVQRETSDNCLDSAGLSTDKRATAGLKTVDSRSDVNVGPQQLVNDAVSDSLQSMDGIEEYCTLVLTTLSTTDNHNAPLQDEDKNCTVTNGSDTSQGNADLSSPASSTEDDHGPVTEYKGICEPSNDTNHPPELENDAKMSISACPPEQNQLSESEVHLKQVKKHDRDQAQVMVLDGQVQMLTVPTKHGEGSDCDTNTKDTASKNHCDYELKGQRCQSCDAQSKHRPVFDHQGAKRSPARQQKTTHDTPSGGVQSKQTCSQLSLDQHVEATSDPTTSETVLSGSLKCQHRKIQRKQLLKGKRILKQFAFTNAHKSVSLQKMFLYIKNKGLFKCKCCGFTSVKLSTVKQHLSTCSRRTNDGSVKDKQDLVKEKNKRTVKGFQKHKIISGLSSPESLLDSLEKNGCMECSMCTFVAKCRMTLTQHILSDHQNQKYGGATPAHLHCQRWTRKKDGCTGQHLPPKPHDCHYCSFSTRRLDHLEEHKALHTGASRHRCSTCDKTFGNVTKLRQHKRRIHDKQPSHFCSLCDYSGYTLDDVRRHNLRCHTGELHHACTQCQACFSSKVALRNHCKRVHQLQVCFSCELCDYTCGSKVTLKMHRQVKHPMLKCTTCQETFDTKEHLGIHQRSHLLHRCQVCTFAAKTRPMLAQHLLNEHEEGSSENKPLQCSSCEFRCLHQLVLEQHLRSHGGKRLYKCTECKYSTQNKQKMTWHIRIHTGEKPYSCEQCTYTCSDPTRLKLHLRVHQDHKKFLCPECGYKCKWATQLKYHMTKHTGDKPYACTQCEYRTNRADALRAHRNTQHRDTRPFVCEHCGKAFKTLFILRTHQRQHSDARPYACGRCHKTFRWPAGLRHHYLSHTHRTPFCCRHCPYRAKQRFQVVRHLHRHHPHLSAEQGVVKDGEGRSLTLKEALEGILNQTEAQGGSKQ